MDKRRSETINTGGAPEPTAEEAAREYEIAGNVKQKGEDPSPDDRDRGETSSKEEESAADISR